MLYLGASVHCHIKSRCERIHNFIRGMDFNKENVGELIPDLEKMVECSL